jgi:hypothetical protein
VTDSHRAITAALATIAHQLAEVAETLKRLETLLQFIASAADAKYAPQPYPKRPAGQLAAPR